MTDKLLLDRWMGNALPEDYIAWAVDMWPWVSSTSAVGQLQTFQTSLRMSEVGVRADVARRWLGLPLIARSGHSSAP